MSKTFIVASKSLARNEFTTSVCFITYFFHFYLLSLLVATVSQLFMSEYLFIYLFIYLFVKPHKTSDKTVQYKIE